MGLVRPTSDIASFPGAGWTVSPLFSKVNSTERDDSTFITGLAPAAEDPQVAFGLDDLEIPFGSSGRIEVRVAMRWNQLLTVVPDTVRIGLADAADLIGDDPTLLFERDMTGTDIVSLDAQEFETFEVVFNYEDFAGDAAAFGIYIEMTPNSADAAAVGEISWIEVLSCVPAVLVETCSLGSLTAGDVIRVARDEHASFDDRTHPDASLFRLLSNYQRSMIAKVARVNPALCASDLVVTLPLADFASGVKLPSFTYVLPNPTLIATTGSLREPIDLLNLALQSDFETPMKFAYLQGGSLFLGRLEQNYQAYDQLRLQLVLTPKRLVALTDPLALPDYAEDTYVGHLASRMARRVVGLAGFENGAELEFLEAVARQKGAEASHTRDVFPGGM